MRRAASTERTAAVGVMALDAERGNEISVSPWHFDVENRAPAVEVLDGGDDHRSCFGAKSFANLKLSCANPVVSVNRPERVQRRWFQRLVGPNEVQSEHRAIDVSDGSADQAPRSRLDRAITNARYVCLPVDLELVDLERDLVSALDRVILDPIR